MTSQEPSPSNKSNVSVFREYFSSILAFVIVGAFLVMVGATLPVAFRGDDAALTLSKDLLTLISPFAGMVIGYYFNKATSDARAENAEQNAKVATQTAQNATLERERAANQVREAEEEIQAMRADLLEMWTAANDMVHEMPAFGVEQIKAGVEPEGVVKTILPLVEAKTMWKLQEALKKAEKWK